MLMGVAAKTQLNALMGKLPEILEDVDAPSLPTQVLPRRKRPGTASPGMGMNHIKRDAIAQRPVVIIKDILSFPPCPDLIEHMIQTAFSYHDNLQFEMALSTLTAAQSEFVQLSDPIDLPIEMKIFFSLAIGNVYESQKNDHDALLQFVVSATAQPGHGQTSKHLSRTVSSYSDHWV